MSDCEKNTERSTTELSGNYTLDFGEDLTYCQHGKDVPYFSYRDAEGTEHFEPATEPVLEVALRRVMAEVRELRAQVTDLQPPF